MSETNAAYRWLVSPNSDSPIAPGVYEILLVKGGTYRNIGSRRKYTVVEINPDRNTIKYQYTRGQGETITRTAQPNELAVVKTVDDSQGGIVGRLGGGDYE